ncbi:MAG: PIG-L family deacetylase, partial [Myxococcaceae bacterium]|nr:PIG-L family deacetylase [Myxococcaceae bacterium]
MCQTEAPLSFRLFACAIFGFASLACQGRAPRQPVDVLVIGTHPDDEVLLGGGVLEAAAREGKRTAVIIVTNGDYGCERDGWAREDESIAGLAELGVAERDVHFLGYPDGHLPELGREPLAPVDRRDAEGRCVRGNTTYARRGRRGTDEHTHRTGAPAVYTSDALVEDLVALLTKLQPREVYLPHAIDEHPDHAMTYVYFRRALDRLETAPREVHRAIVHLGDCWPANDCKTPLTLDEKVAPLPAPYDLYVPSERVPADARLKLAAISHHVSQLGATPHASWLMSFARPEELFFPEAFERGNWGWERRLATSDPATELELELTPGVPTVLRAAEPSTSTELYELTVAGHAVELARSDGDRRIVAGRWNTPGADERVLRVRIDARPDDGELTEWTLYGLGGFIGEAVTPGLLPGVAMGRKPEPESELER